jgi:hypothetical protein
MSSQINAVPYIKRLMEEKIFLIKDIDKIIHCKGSFKTH